MRFFLFIIIYLPQLLIAQQGASISQPILLTPESLKTFKAPFDTTFIAFIQDSIQQNIELKLSCSSWEIIYPNIEFKNYRFDNWGEIILPEKEILAGYCFCSSCSKNKRTLTVSQSKNVVIKIINCQNAHQVNQQIAKIITPKKWYEKTWQKGEKINLENLLFYPNKSMFLNESFEELNELFLLLDKQKQLKIDILGHVNGPKSKNTEEFQLLSENRAKAVYDYLIKRGINSNRLSHKGFGNTQMVFPKAETEEEMKLNRRVEILIL
jgi:outer membrane protein OmpA-like peptidoglycan-associated protein